MIYGCGIDVEERERFTKYAGHLEYPDIMSMIYTVNEQDNYKQFNSSLCLAISFSCKEAYFKAFGLSWSNSNLDWKDIEILFTGKPEEKKAVVNFYGEADRILRDEQIMKPTTFNYSVTESFIVFEAQLICQK